MIGLALSKTGTVTDNLAALVLSFGVDTGGCLVGIALSKTGPGTDNRAALAGFELPRLFSILTLQHPPARQPVLSYRPYGSYVSFFSDR